MLEPLECYCIAYLFFFACKVNEPRTIFASDTMLFTLHFNEFQKNEISRGRMPRLIIYIKDLHGVSKNDGFRTFV